MPDLTLSTLALDHLAEGVLLLDAAGRTAYANRAAAAMFGRSAKALAGMPFSAPIRTDAPVELVILNAETGAEVIAEMQVVPLRAGDDTLSVVSLRDVTARQQAEQQLRESEATYRSVIASANDGFWVTDRDVTILEVNQAYLAMTGYAEKDLIGHRPDVVDPDHDAGAVAARAREIMDQGRAVFETRHRAKDGRILDVAISASFVDVAGGRLFVFIRDITPRKQAEADLLAAKIAAETANRAKSEFLAAMSHDLRTPLNAIMGFAEMMQAEVFGPLGDSHYREYCENIHSSGALLVSLVNDLLDLSKIEAGRYELHEEALDLAAVMESARQQTAIMARQHGQEVVTEPPPTQARLVADERALLQIFNNLLSNAIKFNRQGLPVRFSAGMDDDGTPRVQVADQGIGMTPEAIEKALSPFETVDSVHARAHQGTGLGLHLSTRLMTLLGGTLHIDSTPDVGTTVTLRFSAKRAAPS
jgi:PAS domain S-box-containing protein